MDRVKPAYLRDGLSVETPFLKTFLPNVISAGRGPTLFGKEPDLPNPLIDQNPSPRDTL